MKDILANQQQTLSFNLVVNCGADADQSVHHEHLHLVPRYPNTPLSLSADSWAALANREDRMIGR